MYLLINSAHSIMNKILASVLFALLLMSCSDSSTDPKLSKPDYGIAGDGNLTQILDYVVEETGIPATAALLFKDGQIVEMAASGKTQKGGTESVSTSSKWHIGSITKSMTSTLAGIFVERNLINWNTTIAQVFPEYTSIILQKYHSVTLQELLSDSTGMGE